MEGLRGLAGVHGALARAQGLIEILGNGDGELISHKVPMTCLNPARL